MANHSQSQSSYHSPTTRPLFRGVQIVDYLFGLLEVFLVFRFFLRLAGANPGAGFTDFVYSVSWPFVAPFFAVFRLTVVEGNVIEWTTILAIIVYWLVSIGIKRLLVMSKSVSTPEAAAKLEEKEEDL
ncbi:MAG: YggT family protein [Candidatus Liptonbacteria bacterium]|nr:YggT family protein [Candidatus Liptonbacteria bacterium]